MTGIQTLDNLYSMKEVDSQHGGVEFSSFIVPIKCESNVFFLPSLPISHSFFLVNL